MTPTDFNYGRFLKRWFAAGEQNPGVFVLGCYARYVTLYSQQMRALNLVGALDQEKQLQPGTEVAVVGGGVGGLTAAIAAQLRGAKVTLFEKEQGLMAVQRPCRDRWLHPHIYDWPTDNSEEPRAGLPILDWKADMAENVIGEFDTFCKKSQADVSKIEKHSLVRQVDIKIQNGLPLVMWHHRSRPVSKPFSIVIMAVGFGLEPSSDTRSSYWQGDGLDFPGVRDHRWLVVGSGDSALTDLMRLCIHQFRHANLLNLLPRGDAMESIKADLLEIEKLRYKPEILSAKYENLDVKKLADALEGAEYREGKDVCMTNREGYPYDPRASILNRFILRLLIEKKWVKFLPDYEGRTEAMTEHFQGEKKARRYYKAKFGAQLEEFDKVLERFGPDSAMASFTDLYEQTKPLRDQWVNLPSDADESRKRLWPAGLFGREAQISTADLRSDIGIRAKSFSATKQILSDGRSYLTLTLEGLTVDRGELRGIWVRLRSLAGVIGAPEPDEGAQQLGARWRPDDEDPIPDDANLEERLELAREQASQISGVMVFDSPLTPTSGPVRIGMRVVMLNAVALTSWQFEQFYEEDQRKHIDGAPTDNLEYFARATWFPVETFKMQLELPQEFNEAPAVRCFKYSAEIDRTNVLADGILNLGPGRDSIPFPWVPTERAAKKWTFSKVTGNIWELEVDAPAIGTCFSLEWTLPAQAPDERAAQIEAKARDLRKNLLAYRWQRLEGDTSGGVHQAFRDFEQMVRTLCAENLEDERLEVSLMTYNERTRRLQVVETAINGGEPKPNSWNFWLSFGLGLAGACFKDPSAYLYVPPPEENPAGPDYFLPVPGREDNPAAILALPLDHADYDDSVQLERSRQCIGVVDIVTNLKTTKLLDVVSSDRLWDLVTLCREFSRRLGESFGVPDASKC